MNSITQITQGTSQIISSITTFFITYKVKGIAGQCHAEKRKAFLFLPSLVTYFHLFLLKNPCT